MKSRKLQNPPKVAYDVLYGATSVPSVWIMQRYHVGKKVSPKRRRQMHWMNFLHRKWYAVTWQRICDSNGLARKLQKWQTNALHRHRQLKSPNTSQSVIVGTSVIRRHGNRFDWKSKCQAPLHLNYKLHGYEHDHGNELKHEIWGNVMLSSWIQAEN